MLLTSANGASFSGPGWDVISYRAKAAKHVLVGEDHFTKEIPLFIEAIGLDSPFENFFLEVDPYTTELIEKSFEDADQRKTFNVRYEGILSFLLLERRIQASRGNGWSRHRTVGF